MSLLETHPSHGGRSRLARAASCSPSWITRVLKGSMQLTPDQALGIASELDLGERETDFFLLLVDQERAATLALKKRLGGRLAELRSEGERLSSSLDSRHSVSEQHRMRYYSSWVYSAVHVGCMIGRPSLDELSRRVRIGRSALAPVLDGLREMGLVERQGAGWQATERSMHLPSEHPLTNVTHAAWRQKATQKLQEQGSGDGLHYSGVHCVSTRDLERIRQQLKAFLLQARKEIEASPSEKLAVFCLDWFEL